MYVNEQPQNENGHGHASDFMFGLVCGAAVGAAIGLLLAPKSGAELRHQLAWSADRVRARAKDTYNHASETVQDAVDRSRSVVSDIANTGRDVANEAIERGREAATDVLAQGKQAISDTLEHADRIRRGAQERELT